MIFKFKEFLNENRHEIELHYYAFDFDDNILHMPTFIHMDKLVDGEWIPTDVSTSEFAKVRNDKEVWRLLNNDPVSAFSEFRDVGPRGDNAFIEDVKKALSQNDQGPSWDNFIKCLSEGAIFSIITARGHEPDTIRKAVEFIIDNYLSDEDSNLLYNNCLKHAYIFADNGDFDRIPSGILSQTALIKTYLDNCDYYGVTSDWFINKFGSVSASNPEKAKEMALEEFINKCNKLGHSIGAKSVSVGFSDDDSGNVEHVRAYFKEKSALFNKLSSHDVKLNLYDTSDRSVKGGVRDKFHPVTESDAGAPGLASSILPYTQFNNLADKYFPSDTSDIGGGSLSLKRGVKHLSKNEEGWIGDVVKDKGALRKTLKKKKGEKITKSDIKKEIDKLKKKDKDPKKPGIQGLSKSDQKKHKRLVLAKTLKSFESLSNSLKSGFVEDDILDTMRKYQKVVEDSYRATAVSPVIDYQFTFKLEENDHRIMWDDSSLCAVHITNDDESSAREISDYELKGMVT